MTTWWWVRHGPTHEKTFVGWRDVAADLSDTDQIARLRLMLPETALLVSSDLSRAVTTADAISTGQTRLPHAFRLREFNFGDWDGLGFEQVTKANPDTSRAYWENPGDVAPPNGESWNTAAARVNGFVDEMNRQHTGEHIIAVAHIGVIMTQVQTATAKSARDTIAQPIDNLSLTRLRFDTRGWHVDMINHVP